jgi:uncharacterized protein (TIGR03067 family)
MRLVHLVTVAALGLVLVAADDKTDDAKKDKEKLAGKWTVVSSTLDGKEQDKSEDNSLTFDGDALTIHFKGKEHKATFKIDPEKKPKQIDVTPTDGDEKDKVLKGIYSLEKEDLKICIAHGEGKDRPTEFESKEDSQILLIVLKKAK